MVDDCPDIGGPDASRIDPRRIQQLITVYRDGLLEDTLPFWLRHAVDDRFGGYFSALDRQGRVIDTDKAIWIQGRFAWLLSTLYMQVEARPLWLQVARSGIDFLLKHGFDRDGKMFFQVTREGRPLRKRRYVFSEMFTVMALAAYAQAAEDQTLARRAERLFQETTRLLTTPGALTAKVDPQTRPARSFGVPMILLNTAQVLRETLGSSQADEWIEWSIDQIRRYHLNETHRAVLELSGPEGELIDHYDGRTLNPGHAIEGAWFLLHEARYRGGDDRLTELGTRMLDWMWRWGWDSEHGGILYYRDVRGFPVQEYWHDMKFWWPQNETILATLLAYCMTGKPRYAQWHTAIHDWTYRHFPDPEYGEWYGYLHRDGRIASTAKGTMWKGPFHLPRMQLRCWQMLEYVCRNPAAIAVPALAGLQKPEGGTTSKLRNRH